MATVSATIKRLLSEKDAGAIAAADAVKEILAEVRRQAVAELGAVPAESYSAYYLRRNLSSIEEHLARFASAAGRSLQEAIDGAWMDGAGMVADATRAGGLYIGFGHIPGPLLQAIRDTAVFRIEGLADAAFDKIRGELTLGILGSKTPGEVVKAVAGSLDGPGIFSGIEARAETIVKLEMGRAFSAATHQGLSQAAASVPELQKQWWHAGHPKKPRFTHVMAHGQVKPVGEPFDIGLVKMDYPRAPDAPADEVIRCACEMVPWHPSWEDFPDGGALPVHDARGNVVAKK